MECISSALGPIKAILWGERACGYLGAPVVCDDYMLIIQDEHIHDAATQLQAAGFHPCSWSFGSRKPEVYKTDQAQRLYRSITRGYRNLDRVSIRFLFPTVEPDEIAKVVLLPSSYAHISASNNTLQLQANIFCPDARQLLTSFVRTIVREPFDGMWTSNLTVWAISYTYGYSALSEDVLDSCDDDEAKSWFNKEIRRFGGGFDRTTITKRLGKGGNGVAGEEEA
ncbi:hypothetical protein BHE90_012413 [Fusarium euwallaceae]|uniref:Uncharacterized protein n=1 Tax=Fusarium euwallaceae TaxID=1147111 RepID=A0A430LBV2_9HYPO|nr:hypothetical protein BHE90_012413 [Fusarium euwallaceae]